MSDVRLTCHRCGGTGTIPSPCLSATLALLETGQSYTGREVGEILGIDANLGHARLRKLHELGHIRQERIGRRNRYLI